MKTWLPVLFLFAGCKQDTDFQQLFPRIAVAPAALDYGEVAAPLTDVQELFITNNGRARLQVVFDIDGDVNAFSIDTEDQEIAVGDTLTVPVTFAPPSFLDYAANLVITSNDDENPEVTVPLAGIGVDAPMPDIEVTPLTVDFGTVDQGSNGVQYVLLRNVGDAPLEIGTILQEGSGAFVLQTDPSNNIVGPESDVPIILSYEPFGPDGDSGGLTIPSNDPDEPVIEVVILGNGGGDFAYPIADINCPGTSEPPIWAELDGLSSSDPEGHYPLAYAWTLLSKPEGSQENLTNLTTDNTRIFTDVAGPYEVQLVVTNAAGTVSAPDRCTIDAIPADELHIELSWDTPAANLDLHVARNGGGMFDLPDDCSFCNTSPNWGVSGTDDNPRLDLDDQGGFGPENINIRTPAESDYTVRVHYWEEHGDDAVTATVRVWTFGALEWEGQRVMTRNEVWDVGQVNWPDGSFGVFSINNYAQPDRTCTP